MAELAIAREVIDSKLLAAEPDLRDNAHIAYRYMSAFERTELFTAAYEKAFRQKHGQHFDVYEAERAIPIDPEYIRNGPAELTALWHARQHADRLGIEYELFIREASEVVIQRWTKKRVPRPNQLWRESQLAEVRQAWDRHRETGGHMPRDDWDRRFQADAYRGDPAQEACLRSIEEYVTSIPRGRQAMRLANYLRRGWIGLDQAEKRFGNELAAEAARDAGEYVSASGLNSEDGAPYWPACLGLVVDHAAPGCAGCDARVTCRKLMTLTDKELISRHGATDPRVEARRRDVRERVRRFRARRREAESAAAVGSDSASPPIE